MKINREGSRNLRFLKLFEEINMIGSKMTKTRKYVLLLLLVWLCCNIVVIGNLHAQELFEENIYVQVFFAFPPLGEPMLVQDVYLEFKNIPENNPPINTSLEAFSDGFISAEFKDMGYLYPSTPIISSTYRLRKLMRMKILKNS